MARAFGLEGGAVSYQAVRWALQQPVKPSAAKFILVALAHYVAHDSEGREAFASVSTLVEATCQDRKTVLANLQRLEQMGYLRDTGRRTGGTKSVTVYELCTPSSSPKSGTAKQSQFSHEGVPDSVLLSGPENGTPSVGEAVPDFPGSSTVFPGKQSQISHEAVPIFPTEEVLQGKKQKVLKEKPRALAHAKPGNLVDPLPDWLPAEAWERFDRFRTKKSGKGWTDDARALNLRTLARLRNEGQDPVAVIDQSIEKGWAGLFPVRDGAIASPQRGTMTSRQERAEQAHQEFLRLTGGAPDDGNTIDMEAAHAGHR